MPGSTFPALTSPSWKLTRTPQWETRVQISASGARCAAASRSTPRWQWTLKNGVLQSAETISDLQAIESFVNSLMGMYDSFLWTDPEPASSTTGVITVSLLSDSYDFERVAHELWQLGKLSFEQVAS